MAQIRPIPDVKITDRYLTPVVHGFPLNQSSRMPVYGDEPRFSSRYDHDFECVKCYRSSVLLEDSGIEAEYTATERCALYRFRYPANEAAHMRIALSDEGELSFDGALVRGAENTKVRPAPSR